MKTIALRQLLREPLKVKRWTRAGQAVQITEDGEPLWIIQPAVTTKDELKRQKAVGELLDQVLREPESRISLSQLIKDSRHWKK